MLDVKLPAYEGPLDLLLRLIERNEIDIYNIPIALLADEYMEEIMGSGMEQMSEFLVMAATLLEIKSRMLLPKPPTESSEEILPDPETVTVSTPDGEYIMGRNFDIADAQNTLVHTKPENGYESLATASGMVLGYVDHMPGTVLGRLFMLAAPYFVVDGINEKGLSAAILLLYASPPVNQDTGKISITTTITIRMLLDKAATVEEGIELMAQHDMHSIGNSNLHFQLADATGDSAVIEYVNGEMRVLRSEANGQAVTNFFLSADVKEEYRDGEDRITILQAALDENKGIVTAEKAMQMLESVKAVHDFDQLSGMDYNTSYSIVFNNTTHSMDVCANMNYETVYSFEVRGGR